MFTAKDEYGKLERKHWPCDGSKPLKEKEQLSCMSGADCFTLGKKKTNKQTVGFTLFSVHFLNLKVESHVFSFSRCW